MFLIISCMALGIFIGVLCKKRPIKGSDKIIRILIWALLFLLGYEIGRNKLVFDSLGSIGLQALLIGISATLFSAISAWLLEKVLKRINWNEK